MNDQHFPQRKSPRLQGYDYSQSGAYFVTICTHDRYHLFGTIQDGTMTLNDAGKIAAERWFALPQHHPHIELDAFIVMPNHVHGIIVIVGTRPASSVPSDHVGVTSGSLGAVMGSYKSGVTRRIRQALKDSYLNVWQERYHDHIIRNEAALNYIRRYTFNNPALWQEDTFYSG